MALTWRYMLQELRAGRAPGNPLGEQRKVTVNGQEYVLQVFALDTLYAPVPRWNEIGRLSDLLKLQVVMFAQLPA